MTARRTYGLLSIAQRHPRMFAAMHRAQPVADDLARVVRGQPYTWPQVPWRSDAPARRRNEPRASRFGEMA